MYVLEGNVLYIGTVRVRVCVLVNLMTQDKQKHGAILLNKNLVTLRSFSKLLQQANGNEDQHVTQNKLTPWRRVLTEHVIVAQLVNNSPAFDRSHAPLCSLYPNNGSCPMPEE